MESTRQRKFAKMIQREMSQIFQREIDGLEQVIVSINYVYVTADLGIARFYLTTLPDEALPDVMDFLQRENKGIRHLLAQRIKNVAKFVPELEFFEDEQMQESRRLEDLFERLRREEGRDGDEDASDASDQQAASDA
jgi:ribosome-binding factor A